MGTRLSARYYLQQHFDNINELTKICVCFSNFNFSLRLTAILLPFIKCNKPIKENWFSCQFLMSHCQLFCITGFKLAFFKAFFFNFQTGETYALKTTYEKAYNASWIMVTGWESVIFNVRACADAHLALATIPGNYHS